jgi:hypothetical protein
MQLLFIVFRSPSVIIDLSTMQIIGDCRRFQFKKKEEEKKKMML